MSQIKINFQWHFKLALDFLPQENWQQKIGRKFNEPFNFFKFLLAADFPLQKD